MSRHAFAFLILSIMAITPGTISRDREPRSEYLNKSRLSEDSRSDARNMDSRSMDVVSRNESRDLSVNEKAVDSRNEARNLNTRTKNVDSKNDLRNSDTRKNALDSRKGSRNLKSGRKTPDSRNELLIVNKGRGTVEELVAFVTQNNNRADVAYVNRLIRNYIYESRREGINHDIAVCQMCLETGFLQFTGSVDRHQNNFCGLGATDEWDPGERFGSMEEGVRAHIQHLKAYASVEPLVTPQVDPRLNLVRRGSAKTVHDLSGRWAADPKYGDKIEGLLRQLYSR